MKARVPRGAATPSPFSPTDLSTVSGDSLPVDFDSAPTVKSSAPTLRGLSVGWRCMQ